MTDQSLYEEDDEEQLGSYKLEECVLLSTPLSENNDTESDTVSSGSSASRKQLKSPHTLLKHAPSRCPRGSVCNNPTWPQNDQAEHYQRLLQEAEQSLSSRDVLIEILQEQLKKIQNHYKQSLDDAQDLRHKYCVTVQDLSNLRLICEKYKEDVQLLTKKEQNGCSKKWELQKLQNEVEAWKTQYQHLLTQVKVVEKEAAAAAGKLSKEIQVDLLENPNLITDINIVKERCISIQNCLEEQNTKIDFVVKQLQEDTQQLDFFKRKLETISEEELINITEGPVNLKRDLKNLQSKNVHSNNKCTEDNVLQELNDNEENDSGLNMQQSRKIKDEMEKFKLEIKKLNKENLQLQSQIHEIDKLKDEIKKLNIQLRNEEVIDRSMSTSSPVSIRDSLMDHLKKENLHLRGKVDTLKNEARLHQYSADDQNSCKEDSTYSSETNDYAHQVRSRQASRVSFAVTNDCLQAELIELHQENSELKMKIREMEEGNVNNDEKDRLTVELVNLGRQLKHKQEEVDRFQHEADTAASKKNSIIQEFQTANDLLKSDYQELLEINSKLVNDLKNKTAGIYEHKTLDDAYNGLNTPINNNINYNELNDKGNIHINNTIPEPDKVNIKNLNKNTTDIIKEAVNNSINTEMEKLKATLCNNAECQIIIEENHAIKDELNEKTKELKIIAGDLEIKTSELIEKARIIRNQNSEIEKLKKSINNNTKLQDTDEMKTELESKRREIVDNRTKIQDLQSTINVLKSKLAQAMLENENKDRDLQEHIDCMCKLKNMEAEISTLKDLTQNFTMENESLNAQISMMKNTLRQYQEEAEFKKLENEKLRLKEEQLQSAVSLARRNSDNLAREFQKEIEKNKLTVSQLSKEYNNTEKECQTKVNTINGENQELKQLLQQKDETLKALTDQINTLLKELEENKSLYQKNLNTYDRSIDEIKYLYKSKEDELVSTINELQNQEERLELLEKENERFRNLPQKNDPAEADDSHLQAAIQFKTLEESFAKEKNKNGEMKTSLDNIREDLHNLKVQLQELLKGLECKLKILRNDLLSNKGDISVSKKSLNEILEYIEKFNCGMFQRQPTTKQNDNSNSSIEESEKYSYYYDTTNEDYAETFPYTQYNCRRKTTTNSSSPAYSCPILPKYNQNFEQLQIKQENFIRELDNMEQKLNDSYDPPIIKILPPKCMSPSCESILTPRTKHDNKDSHYTCPQMCEVGETGSEDMFVEQEERSRNNLLICENTDASRIRANTENKTAYELKNGSECFSACGQWKTNSEVGSNLLKQKTISGGIDKSIKSNIKEDAKNDESSLHKSKSEIMIENSSVGKNIQVNNENIEKKIADKFRSGKSCSSTCSQWKESLDVIYEIISNMHISSNESIARKESFVSENTDTNKIKHNTDNQTAGEKKDLEMIFQRTPNLPTLTIELSTEKQSIIDENTDTNKIKDIKKQTPEGSTNGSNCSSTCAQGQKEIETTYQVVSDSHRSENASTIQRRSSTSTLENLSLKNYSLEECLQNATDLQLGVKYLPNPFAGCSVMEDNDRHNESLPQQSISANFSEKSKSEIYENKSENKIISTSKSKEQKQEARFNGNTTEFVECPKCPSQKPTPHVESPRCYTVEKENKNPADNTLKSASGVMRQNKKCTNLPTAIPVLIQNSQKNIRGKCPSVASKSRANDTQKTIHGQNCHSGNLNIMKPKSTVSRLNTGAKGIVPSCVCLKRIPGTTGATNLPLTSTPAKNCPCLSSNKKRTTTLLENTKYDTKCETKTIKCTCQPEPSKKD